MEIDKSATYSFTEALVDDGFVGPKPTLDRVGVSCKKMERFFVKKFWLAVRMLSSRR
jgi:hypothetical protein